MVRKLVLAFAIALGAIGCKHPGSAKLEGHWKGTHAEGVTGPSQDAANAFAVATEVIARGNQITVNTPSTRGPQSAYVVDDENKTTVVLHTEKDGPNAKETFVFGDDGKTMTWKMGEGHSIAFKKIKD